MTKTEIKAMTKRLNPTQKQLLEKGVITIGIEMYSDRWEQFEIVWTGMRKEEIEKLAKENPEKVFYNMTNVESYDFLKALDVDMSNLNSYYAWHKRTGRW